MEQPGERWIMDKRESGLSVASVVGCVVHGEVFCFGNEYGGLLLGLTGDFHWGVVVWIRRKSGPSASTETLACIDGNVSPGCLRDG